MSFKFVKSTEKYVDVAALYICGCTFASTHNKFDKFLFNYLDTNL